MSIEMESRCDPTLRAALPRAGRGSGSGEIRVTDTLTPADAWWQPLHPDPLPANGGGRERPPEILDDAADDRSPRRPDGGDRLPVGPVRHGRRADPDRRAAGADAAADRDGAARHYANGLERLARLSVARAYPLAAGLGLPDRLRAGARGVVDHPLRAGQADRAVDPRHHAVPGAAAAEGHQAQSGQRRGRARCTARSAWD